MKNLFASFLFLLSITVFSQKIPFQGRLLDDGRPFNGTTSIDFSIDSPPWSESFANVAVVDGYYAVVLGETTPLPDTLFFESPEVLLNISVNGQALTPITLFSPLLPYTGPEGIEVDTLRAFMAEAIGIEDEGKARIATTNGGYDGIMSLTDSLGRTGNFIRTRKSGGYLQLTQQDFTDDSFKSAAVMATTGDQNSYMDLFGGNAANDGFELMVDVYGSNIDLDGPIADGYRRGGIDIKNYHGNFTHNIYSEQNGASATSWMNLVASQETGELTYSLQLSSGDGISTGGSINMTDETGAGSILLDGTTGTIDAQAILINGVPVEGSSGGTIEPDTVRSNSVQVMSPLGELKADLSYFEPNDAGSVVLYANNDSRNIILGSSGITGGDTGFLGMYDTNDQIKIALRVDTLEGGGQDHGKMILNNSDYSKSLVLDGSRSAVIADTLETQEITLFGESGNEKVQIGSENSGYDGVIVLKDSLNNTGAFMTTNRGTGTGGYLQLNGNNTSDGSTRSAVVAGTILDSRQNSFMDLYGENANADGATLLVDVYAADLDLNGPIPDGYRRGGIDIYNYYGSPTHNFFSYQEGSLAKSAMALNASENGNNVKQTVWITSGDSIKDAGLEFRGKDLSLVRAGISQDTGGADPTGTSGGIEFYGDQSINIQLGGLGFEDHDLPILNMYGSIDDGGGFWFNTTQLNGFKTSDGLSEFGNVLLFNNTSGSSTQTTYITGNLDETGAGGLELNDNTGANRILLNGVNGNISANRNDGGSAINMFVSGNNGGLSIQNASDQNKLFYEAGAGILSLKDDAGTETFSLDGNFGNMSNSGSITTTLLIQTSDRRLKHNISDLSNSLEKTMKLRGVSYQWKDQTKTQDNQIGLIAQEVEEVFPEFVHTNEEGMKAVNYAQLNAVLIEAIKELNSKVESLENENTKLKSSLEEVSQLRAEMDQLMQSLSGRKTASK